VSYKIDYLSRARREIKKLRVKFKSTLSMLSKRCLMHPDRMTLRSSLAMRTGGESAQAITELSIRYMMMFLRF
jgi:mRNA-degrading endonuclease RelE of RelBE toxin-antitoxin system